MRVQGVHHHHITSTNPTNPTPVFPITVYHFSKTQTLNTVNNNHTQSQKLRICRIPATLGPETSKRFSSLLAAAAAQPSQPLDLTEDNIRQVLADARVEFGQLFDTSVGMTGIVPSFTHKISYFLSYFVQFLYCGFFFWVKLYCGIDQLGFGEWFVGQVELADLDGPFVKISLRGRFWHERSLVLARLANYLKQRIPVSFI